jgi:hypothetical protein
MSSPREIAVIWDRYEQLRERISQTRDKYPHLQTKLDNDLATLQAIESKIRQSKSIGNYYLSFAELEKATLTIEKALANSLSTKTAPTSLKELQAMNARKVQPIVMTKQGHEAHKLTLVGSLYPEADAILKIVRHLEQQVKLLYWQAPASKKSYLANFLKQTLPQMKSDAGHFLQLVENSTTADVAGLTYMKDNMLKNFMTAIETQTQNLDSVKVKTDVSLKPYQEAFKELTTGGKSIHSPIIKNMIETKKRAHQESPLRMVKTKEESLSVAIVQKADACQTLIDSLKNQLNNYLNSPHNTSHKRDNEVKLLLKKLERWDSDVKEITQQVSNATSADNAGISHRTEKFIDGVINLLKSEKKAINSIFKGKFSTILDTTLSQAKNIKEEPQHPTPTRRR